MAIAALLSEAPRPYMTPFSIVALNGSVRHSERSPVFTTSMCESKTMWTGPSPILPIALPNPSTITSSNPTACISSPIRWTTACSSRDRLGRSITSARKRVTSSRTRSDSCWYRSSNFMTRPRRRGRRR